MSTFLYILEIITMIIQYLFILIVSPFAAYGASQYLAELFPRSAYFIELWENFKVSPVFLSITSLFMICAFVLFTVSTSGLLKNRSDKHCLKLLSISIVIIFLETLFSIIYMSGVFGNDTTGIYISIAGSILPILQLFFFCFVLNLFIFTFRNIRENRNK